MRPVETSLMRVDTDRAANLDELLALLAGDDAYTYSVAWIDLLARGRALGRSVLTRGEHARLDELPARRAASPLAFSARERLRAPAHVPSGLMNRWSVGAFNELWFRKAPRRRRDEIQDLATFFHPLDGVAGWNSLYGRRGFTQYQFVVPLDAVDTLRAAVDRISAAGHASFLAVLKRFGPGNDGLLSFPMEGWTLALDLPVSPDLSRLFDELDELVVGAGGRVYLAKDSRTAPATLAAMYPRLEEFRKIRREADPDGVFQSDLARRLHL
jgi:decaprenylphospho-beta-D-ribofuranose 2-oxidase